MSDLRKAAQMALEALIWHDETVRTRADSAAIIELRAALAIPEPPLSTGGWHHSVDGKQIFHDDFEFDAKLKVSGDFGTDEQRIKFAQAVTNTLNGGALAPPQHSEHQTSYEELDCIASDLHDLCERQANRIALLENQRKSSPQEAMTRKPLTEEEIYKMFGWYAVPFVRAVERAHGIGEQND